MVAFTHRSMVLWRSDAATMWRARGDEQRSPTGSGVRRPICRYPGRDDRPRHAAVTTNPKARITFKPGADELRELPRMGQASGEDRLSDEDDVTVSLMEPGVLKIFALACVAPTWLRAARSRR